ncbi:MAG: triple tyrosine motif-containing protein [Salinivirgaceae bacterium]
MKSKFIPGILLIWFLFQAMETAAQIKNIGLPFITNHTREQYNAETQNWCITQDDKGIMYFGNNNGLLVYNGSSWNIYPLPNNSIIRSVKYIDGKIYAGGFNEFGYYQRDSKGELHYTSLIETMAESNKDCGEIWRIFKTDEGIFFQSYTRIFIISQHSVQVLEPKSQFGFSYQINDTIYVVDKEFGLYTINQNKLVPYLLHDTFFVDHEISFMMQNSGHKLVLGSTNQGVFFLDKKGIKPWKSKINEHFIKNQIYTGKQLNAQQIAIGTIQDGVYIINLQGEIILKLNRLRGLQNNTVLSLFYDKNQNLWLGLDNGIDMLEVNSPLTIIDYSYQIETSYTSIIHNNNLYVGTNQGLFVKPLHQITNSHLLESGFTKIDGTLGQVWSLYESGDQLFCGHNLGTFLINGMEARLISANMGGWNYQPVPWNSNLLIGGTYNGLNRYEKNTATKQWESTGMVSDFNESSKDIAFDALNNLWINHGLKGVYKIQLSNDAKSCINVARYNQSNGLPRLPYLLVPIESQLYFLAQDSIYEYLPDLDAFSVNEKYTTLFEGIKGITKIINDTNGDLWFFTETQLGVFRKLEDGTYNKITKPFFRIHNLFLRSSFENIYTYDATNTLIGSQQGILHYSVNNTKNFDKPYATYLSDVKIKTRNQKADAKDSYPLEVKLELNEAEIEIPFKYNSITFWFYTPFYEAPNKTQHAYRLKGFDDVWSEWSSTSFKEYTNLQEGSYTFEVKALNIYNNESEVRTFHFTIKPPIYRSKLAYLIYAITFLSIVLFNLFYYKHKIEKTRKIESEKYVSKEKAFKKEVKMSEQKIEELEQEKMKGEMRLKNIELANSTMNLIQKNKLLNNVKKELLSVSDKAQSNYVKEDIKGLIKKIDKDITNDQNLKLFDKYFDRVHQDFINRIKEKHPNLTPKDLRLCAYLRMNLSTKEIAPLLNVSIRGLEISRYRLRKKLDLDREANLVDYIMEI